MPDSPGADRHRDDRRGGCGLFLERRLHGLLLLDGLAALELEAAELGRVSVDLLPGDAFILKQLLGRGALGAILAFASPQRLLLRRLEKARVLAHTPNQSGALGNLLEEGGIGKASIDADDQVPVGRRALIHLSAQQRQALPANQVDVLLGALLLISLLAMRPGFIDPLPAAEIGAAFVVVIIASQFT